MTSPSAQWILLGEENFQEGVDDIISSIESINHNPLAGECVLDFCSNVGIDIPQLELRCDGMLLITNFQLKFIYEKEDGSISSGDSCIPLTCISNSTRLTVNSIEIKTKDLRNIKFYFQNLEDREKVLQSIEYYSFWKKNGTQMKSAVFAFSHANAMKGSTQDPTIYFDSKRELDRMMKGWENHFQISNINQSFELCETYPQQLVFPKNLDDGVIRQSAAFRSKRRLPIITWINKNNKSSISRCSQPMIGISLFGKESMGDETLIKSLIDVMDPKPTDPIKLHIVDARSILTAKFNCVNGGGHEMIQRYPDCDLEFLSIANIHGMRNSFRAISKLTFEPNSCELNTYNKTTWMYHIHLILQSSVVIAKRLLNGKSVLIHCSDGWDRTPQISALAQIMLDPFFRTIKGFGILVQKEWISFGHKFSCRIGHGEPENKNTEESPIFLQFLDCVHQIISQYPNYFEFNDNYLTELADMVFSGQYGTFLFDCVRERQNNER
eukprot:TRINITY_DN241_c0_g1_i2.p1 TRINITY_DN241_c0_g1~~TRINITY_DN241_c0_g1_i2.p1  ORF type:complete len:496 (+),score=53.55 TRINITY_DN241_c0_g1_i2:43-1530(+)